MPTDSHLRGMDPEGMKSVARMWQCREPQACVADVESGRRGYPLRCPAPIVVDGVVLAMSRAEGPPKNRLEPGKGTRAVG